MGGVKITKHGSITLLKRNRIIDVLERQSVRERHSKPEDEDPECFCGDACKMEVSCDYKILWLRFWMCNNLAYDPEPGDKDVSYNLF
jgi:hypothetical protein